MNQGVNTIFTLNTVLGSAKVNEIKILLSGEKRVRNANGSNPAVNISQTANVGVISGVGGVFDSTGARALRLGVRMQW